jgi:uncharacterized membrane protein YeaQ/YmgE (transglycosylase-associated protein family)
MLWNIIIWIVVGAVVGWLASMIMRTNRQQGLLMDIIVGIVGAFLGGFLFDAIFNTNTTEDILSIPSILVALLGAIILLAIINLFRRGRVR